MTEALMQRGLLSKETHTHTIRFAPPLIITPDQIDEMMDAVAAALDEAYAVAQQRGLMGRTQSAAG